jgi:hypothetical protein
VSALRALGWLARADLLERLRRSSTVAVLAVTLLAAWLVHTGVLGVEVGGWRGAYDSAWVGMTISLVVSTILGLLGFYLVKDPITRDRRTGVGQILAATPMSSGTYLLGKWVSSSGVLLALLGVLGLAAAAMQVAHGEAPVEPARLAAPLLLVAVPSLLLVAAAATFFESVPFLRGGAGNVLWFFLFTFGLWAGIEILAERAPGLDPFGAGIFLPSLRAAVSAVDPSYDGGFVIGSGESHPVLRTFSWPGVHWTAGLVAARLGLVALAGAVALLPVLWFDRFDAHPAPARRQPRWLAQRERLARLTDRLGLVGAELRMALAGQPWWWHLGMVGVVAVGLAQPSAVVVGWIWPLTVWSALGCRAEQEGTLPLVLSTPRGVVRPVLSAWGAGVMLAAVAGAGHAIRSVADPPSLAAFAAGCALVPALSLACGVWSRGPRLFEVSWLVLWYLGPLERAPGLDVLGSRSPWVISAWSASAAALLALAVVGRRRALRTGRGG